MIENSTFLSVRLATDDLDRRAAQRLRYRVFVEELGGDGVMVDHDARLERDRFDPHFDHLILVDDRIDPESLDHVVGVYRVMTEKAAEAAGQFYSADEYDLSPLLQSGRRLLELGRSCIDPKHRGGSAMWRLWSGLATYVTERQIEVLFGVASFHGTEIARHAEPLSLLHARHLAPEELRVRAADGVYQSMEMMQPDKIDAAAAMRQVPPLIKSYLRLGGFVGDGAFVDHAFNTTDICLVLDVDRMSERQRKLLVAGR